MNTSSELTMNTLRKAHLTTVPSSGSPRDIAQWRKSRAFDRAAIGMALLDTRGHWLDVNAKFCEMLGFSRKDLLARSYESLTVAEDIVKSRRMLQRLNKGEIEFGEIEKRYCRADGEVIWVHIHATIVRPARAGQTFLITQARDISEERRTQEALADSESRLSLALMGADLGMWHWNVTTGEFLFSKSAIEMLGYKKGEVARTRDAIKALCHPDDRAALSEAMRRHLMGDSEAFDRVFRLRQRSGRYLWLLARGRVTRHDPHKRPLQVSGTIMDVTKWKELERRLTQLATTDELTGLSNRRYGMTTLSRGLSESERSGRPYSLILLDVDHFKAINDNLGHEVGDEVLAELGKLLAGNIRQSDMAVRWGGEEFAILLPDTDAEGALLKAQRLFDAMPQVGERIDAVDSLTVSMGVVTSLSGESDHNLLKRADKLMYQAKQAGRARICTDQN
jgi:diguanylate cyclase (GGDEF)-like protein/PAS domain S-box-containing protein